MSPDTRRALATQFLWVYTKAIISNDARVMIKLYSADAVISTPLTGSTQLDLLQALKSLLKLLADSAAERPTDALLDVVVTEIDDSHVRVITTPKDACMTVPAKQEFILCEIRERVYVVCEQRVVM